MFELRPYLRDGVRTSSELRAASGVTRDTIANAYERERSQILRLGRARATRYAARRTLVGLDTDEFPVFRVDEVGKLHSAGKLVTLEAAESVWIPDTSVIDGLPPEMHDVAPKGFLGRSYAQNYADLGLPEDITDWSDNHVLIALSRRGEDLPGNLVIGRESFERFQKLQHKVETSEDYPRLAEKAIAGEHVGSSAGGEQPKFTTYVDGKHRIVKFATDVSDNARRWQDLLLLEHIALQTLNDAGIDAAQTQFLALDGLTCLVVDRFDRVGEMGRRQVVTLAAASENMGGSWTSSAERMHNRGEINDESLYRVALLDAYGSLIANTDRHHYNIALFPRESGYDVAPAFDQLPMAYSPPASGNLRNDAVPQPYAAANTFAVWDEARGLANEFWQRASRQQLTNSMQRIVQEHAQR